MQNLIHGLGALGNGPALGYLFGGALVGMIIGVIPGLSTVVILSIILVFLNHIDLTGTLCLFLGAQCGSFYSASVSAILLNTPAHPESFPITLDGYPMARKGEPGRALGLSAASTCIGGFVGCGVLIGFLQIINSLTDVFHPPEYLALVTLAMLLVGTLGTNSVGKAITAAGAGLVLSSIGPSLITGTFRYTFGAVGLYSGISIVAVALGAFAVPQMVMVYGTASTTARQDMTGKEVGEYQAVEVTDGYARQLIGGILEAFRHWGTLLTSGIVGGLTGIIPGIGGFSGNFMAYGIAKQTSRRSDQFGTGIPEGIIAPEGSSLAKEAGHIVPIIGLGIPGGVAGALFIGALTIKDIRPGYGFQHIYPNVTGEIVWVIALSGLIGTVAGVLLGPQLAKVTKVPGPLLVPFIFAICISGDFLTDVQFFSVMEVVIFGLIGLGMRRLRYPLGSFILGLVLGPTFESNIYLTHKIYPGFSFIGKRPLADGIFLIAIVVLVAKWIELHRETKQAKAQLADQIAHLDDPALRSGAMTQRAMLLAPYPLLAPIMSGAMLVISLYIIIYGASHYNFATAVMPVIGGICMALPTAMFFPRDVYRYVQYRKAKRQSLTTLIDIHAFEHQLVTAGAEHSHDGLAIASSAAANVVNAAEALSSSMTMSPVGDAIVVHDRSWGPNGQYRREVIALAWLIGLLGLCWLIGFTYGCPVFVAVYGLTCTKQFFKSIKTQLLFSVLSAAAIWIITYEMFHLTHLLYTPHFQF